MRPSPWGSMPFGGQPVQNKRNAETTRDSPSELCRWRTALARRDWNASPPANKIRGLAARKHSNQESILYTKPENVLIGNFQFYIEFGASSASLLINDVSGDKSFFNLTLRHLTSSSNDEDQGRRWGGGRRRLQGCGVYNSE